MANDREFWALGEEWERHGLARRDFLRLLLGGASLATIGGILAACGGDAPATPSTSATTTTTTTTATATTTTATTTAAGGAATRTVATGGATTTTTAAATGRAINPSGTGAGTTVGRKNRPRPNGPRGGTMTVAFTSDARSFHPYAVTDTTSGAFIDRVFDGGLLVQRDPDTLEWIPRACESYTLAPDGKTVTFVLRDDLVWSDGRKVSAEDYVWTYQQAIKPENNYPSVDDLNKRVESFVARDPRTLVVTLREGIAIAVQEAAAITPLPKHVWEKYPWNDPNLNPEINKPSVGCGNWKAEEWKKGESATFVANDLSPLGRPNIDRQVLRIFGNSSTAYQALKSGEIDYFGFQVSDYKDAKRQPNLNVFEWYPSSPSWNYMGFNHRRPALKDLRVRRAIAYATDRQGIVDSVVEGLGRGVYSSQVPESWAYNPDVEKYEFNPKRSEELLREAGYSKGRDGKLTKDGQPLNTRLLFGPANNKVREGIATLVQQQLGELGIAVEVQGLEWQAYLDQTRKEPFDYDLYLLAWSLGVDPDNAKIAFTRDNIPIFNRGAYLNDRVEELYAQGIKEFDQEKRAAIYREIQRLLAEDLPCVFLFQGQSIAGVSKRIGGAELTKRQGLNEQNLWFIRQ